MPRTLITTPFPEYPEVRSEGVTIITPHRAAATAIGVGYCSLQRLAEKVVRDRGVNIAPAPLARHTLKNVILQLLPETDASAFRLRVIQILQTVFRTGIDVDLLIEKGSPRVRQLGQIALAYRAELAKNGFIDREELLCRAAAIDSQSRRLCIYGYHRARKEEIGFINAIAGEGSTLYLPCADDGIFTANREWRDWLIGRGWQIAEEVTPRPMSAGADLAARFIGIPSGSQTSTATAYPTIEDEVRGVLSEAKKMVVAGVDPYGIAIVCRNQETYAPVISSIADEYGIPIRIRHNLSLANTAFGGFVRLILESADQNCAYETTARLLLHPFGPGLPEGGWTSARARRASDRETWQALGADLTSLIWTERSPLGHWIAKLNAVLSSFAVREKAARNAREFIALERFQTAISAIARLESSRPISANEFSALVHEVLAEEVVPFSASTTGIALYEPNTILGATFDHLFVIGMAEGVFPAPAAENPVIDFFERKLLVKHGIEFEEAAEVARWEALSFYFTLLAGRRSVSFSYPSTVDNHERMPNAFFGKLGLKPTKASVSTKLVSSIEERRTAILRHETTPVDDTAIEAARVQFAVELRRENSPVYDEYDGVIGVPFDPAARQWSASQLTTIGQCGFRWFAERVLRLKPVDEVELEMDYTLRGTFYHRVMEIAVSRAMGEADIRTATLRHLDEAFAETERDPEIAMPTQVNWELQRPEHIAALRKAVESEEFIGEGSRVIGLEQKFEDVYRTFPLVGYVDRVDDTPEGLAAIDYKTSSVKPKGAKDESGKLCIDVQIPIYSRVALRKLYPDGNLGTSHYYSLVKGKILRSEEEGDQEKLGALLDRIGAMLAGGDFAVDPDVDENACIYCDHETICRKGPRLARKGTTTWS